jgi:16S rRNA (uracil1498-N3)-methyltransferase
MEYFRDNYMRDYHHFLFHTSKSNSTSIELDVYESRHALKVLRLTEGDLFQATSGDGQIFICKLDSIKKELASATIIERLTVPLISPGIHCYIGIPDKDAFEIVVTDLTAMGITQITPLITEQCQKNWWEQKWDKLQERLQGKMIAAMKQSLYPRMPVIDNPCTIEMAIEGNNGQSFIAEWEGSPLHTYQCDIESQVNCFIGPPGGFSTKEIDLFRSLKFIPIKIASTRLRTELASVVLCAQVMASPLCPSP